MTTSSSFQARLIELDRLIGAFDDKVAQLTKEKRVCIRALHNARIRLSYLRSAQWIRKPAQNYSLWGPGLLMVGAGFAVVTSFIVLDLLSLSSAIVNSGCLLGALATVGSLAVLLKNPSDSNLPGAIVDAELQLRQFEARADATLRSLTTAKQQLAVFTADRRQLLQSVEWRRTQLLNRDWRSMRSDEWEDYLVEVFTALGATARRTGKTGDQGVDLVVQIGDRCIAVQAKGYFHTVNNSAVQQAVTGKAHYQCSYAAVITNSQFTRSARELAASNNCVLIGETEFPDFVMGKLRM